MIAQGHRCPGVRKFRIPILFKFPQQKAVQNSSFPREIKFTLPNGGALNDNDVSGEFPGDSNDCRSSGSCGVGSDAPPWPAPIPTI
jgi:hypothetical protein